MKTKRVRLALIQHMHKLLLDSIYAKQKTMQLKQMANLIKENRIKQPESFNAVIFRGNWYTDPYNAEKPRRVPVRLSRSLHPDLWGKANEIMDLDTFTDAVTKNDIDTLIREALFLCKTVDCLIKLIPSVSSEIQNEWDKIFNIGDPLTEKEITDFKLRTVNGTKAMDRLLMRDLLLGI